MTAGAREDYAKEAGAFRFDAVYGLDADVAKKVSDHYPVVAVLRIRCQARSPFLDIGFTRRRFTRIPVKGVMLRTAN